MEENQIPRFTIADYNLIQSARKPPKPKQVVKPVNLEQYEASHLAHSALEMIKEDPEQRSIQVGFMSHANPDQVVKLLQARGFRVHWIQCPDDDGMFKTAVFDFSRPPAN